MKLDVFYNKNDYYIGFSKEENLLCAWTYLFDPYTLKRKPTVLCQYNPTTKYAVFSVFLTDEDIDTQFINKLDKCLKQYGFNS